MLARLARLALVPLALAMASTALLAPPSGAVTGKNIVEDFEHEYVGLVAFYDADGSLPAPLQRHPAVRAGVPDRRALRGR